MKNSFRGRVWCSAIEAERRSGLAYKKALKLYVRRGGDIRVILQSIKAPLRWRTCREDWSRVEYNKYWCRPTIAYWAQRRTKILPF